MTVLAKKEGSVETCIMCIGHVSVTSSIFMFQANPFDPSKDDAVQRYELP